MKVIQETRTKFDIYVFIGSLIIFTMATLYVKILENIVNEVWALKQISMFLLHFYFQI
jgi:hypothetical protein